MEKNRVLFVFAIVLMIWTILFGKGIFLKFFPDPRLSRLEEVQFRKNIQLQPRRGEIFDRKGKELAVSAPSHSLYADPYFVEDPYGVSKKLSSILKVPWKKIYGKLKVKSRRFVWIQRKLSEEKYQRIKKLKTKGLSFILESKRLYPHGSLFAQTLGFVGVDGHGLEGLELEYDEVLTGESQEIKIQRDARNRPLLVDGRIFLEKPKGAQVHLTIDLDLQYAFEKELNKILERHKAKGAMGVILDAQTSEILSLVNLPSFNLNSPLKFPASRRRNKVVTDVFEPGSTMKTVILSSALKKGLLPSKKVYCEQGEFRLDPYVIREADSDHSYGWLSLNEVLAFSSNIGMVKLALELGDRSIRKTLSDFGFGKKTFVGFPGEASGILKKTPWKKHFLGSISFGHGVAVTPLQMASAYAAIANGGVLKTPQLVRMIYDERTKKRYEYDQEKVRRVLTPKQAHTLKLMLVSATSEKGTGYLSRIPGFLVAGKTGTAKKVNTKEGGYFQNKYISSFIGFFPVHKPEIVIYVIVDEPEGVYYGSQVAAPVFSKVASYYVRSKGLSPILISKENVLDPLPEKTYANLKSLSEEALETLEGEDLKVMPKLKGLSLREVYRIFQGVDVRIKVRGKGHVVHTWPSEGKRLRGKDVEVELR